jgi:hypothetical protein
MLYLYRMFYSESPLEVEERESGSFLLSMHQTESDGNT